MGSVGVNRREELGREMNGGGVGGVVDLNPTFVCNSLRLHLAAGVCFFFSFFSGPK